MDAAHAGTCLHSVMLVSSERTINMSEKAVLNLPATEITDLLQERYGAGVVYDVIDTTITRQLLQHRSVRTFEPTPLPEHLLSTLVAAAQSAPSSSNLQSWSVVAIQDKAHKDQFAVWAKNQEFVRQAPLFLVWLADFSRAKLLTQHQDVPIDGTDYLESLILASIDTAIAAQNAVITAESLGLGVVYAGAIRSHIPEIAQDLNLPQYVYPVFGMAIGYPSEQVVTHIRPRLQQHAVLHDEYYDAQPQAASAEAYNTALDAFWKKQSIDHALWTQHLVNRLGDVRTQNDTRYALTDILRKLGFPLI
jgi:nitroreductase